VQGESKTPADEIKPALSAVITERHTTGVEGRSGGGKNNWQQEFVTKTSGPSEKMHEMGKRPS